MSTGKLSTISLPKSQPLSMFDLKTFQKQMKTITPICRQGLARERKGRKGTLKPGPVPDAVSPAVVHSTSLTISSPDVLSPLQAGQESRCPHTTSIDLPFGSTLPQIPHFKQDAAGVVWETQPVRNGGGACRKPDSFHNRFLRSPPDRTHLPPLCLSWLLRRAEGWLPHPLTSTTINYCWMGQKEKLL